MGAQVEAMSFGGTKIVELSSGAAPNWRPRSL